MYSIFWAFCAIFNLCILCRNIKSFLFPWNILIPLYSILIAPVWTVGWIVLKYMELNDD